MSFMIFTLRPHCAPQLLSKNVRHLFSETVFIRFFIVLKQPIKKACGCTEGADDTDGLEFR